MTKKDLGTLRAECESACNSKDISAMAALMATLEYVVELEAEVGALKAEKPEVVGGRVDKGGIPRRHIYAFVRYG